MKVELDWQAENEDGEWETVATVGRATGIRLPLWAWSSALALSLLLALVGYVAVRHRYHRALAWTTFQIQGVVDAEAQAAAKGDGRLFMAQQDRDTPDWYRLQAARLRAMAECGLAQSMGSPATSLELLHRRCWPSLEADVERVEVRGDVAWVELRTQQESLRQVRFYRQTDRGWLHTAPQVAFWQEEAHLIRGKVVVHAHRRDLSYVEPLAHHITTVADDTCAMLHCPTDRGLEVTFAPAHLGPQITRKGLTLPSPWLSGIPDDGCWGQTYLDELTYWVTQQVALEMLHADLARGLQQLEQALVAPHQGLGASDALPASVRSVNQVYGAVQFVERRISPPSTALAVDHLEAVLDIEREARRIGDEAASFLLEEYATLNGSGARAR